VQDELGGCLCRSGVRIGRDRRGIQRCGIHVEPGAGLHRIHDDQPDDQRQRGDGFKVDERLHADAPHLPHVSGFGKPEDHRQEDDGADQHFHQVDEAVAERFQRNRRGGRRDAEHAAGDDANEHLEIQPTRESTHKGLPSGFSTHGDDISPGADGVHRFRRM
jgi:hypothetical protein